MTDNLTIFTEIDNIIAKVDRFKNEPTFSQEIQERQNRRVAPLLNDNEILKTFAHLIAYSQNANSELVEQLLKSEKFDKVFDNFEVDKVIGMNPCDIADIHWKSISVIRQQAKLFHIISLARKLKSIGSLATILNDNTIPRQISNIEDIEIFWSGFNKLQKILKAKKIPFFQSTTSLLHFLLTMGYDCVKPDLIVMRVAKKIKIVESEVGDKNFRLTVKTIQYYSLSRQIRPSIVDFHFLIDEGQRGAKKYVKTDFYA